MHLWERVTCLGCDDASYGAAILGQGLMRSIASGVSAAGTLALAQHLLEPRFPQPWDLSSLCPAAGFDPICFGAGIFVGILLFALVETFVTLRWAFIQFVEQQRSLHQEARGGGRACKGHFRFLDES